MPTLSKTTCISCFLSIYQRPCNTAPHLFPLCIFSPAILDGVNGIDLLLLDGWKPLYIPLLRQLEPSLSPGCLIVADDVISLSEKVAPYLAYVRDATNGYVSC